MRILCALFCLAVLTNPAFAQVPAATKPPPKGPVAGAAADYHVPVKGDLTLDEALRRR